jgi:hypothetical protein
MKRGRTAVAAVGIATAPLIMATGCEHFPDPVVDNIGAASAKYHLSAAGMLGLGTCESMLEVDPKPKSKYGGTYQHLRRLWPGRVATYNARHPEERVSGKINDPRSMAFVTADMIATGGLGPWQCETDYRCYSNPDGNKKMCKPSVWRKRLALTGKAAIGSQIIDLHPPTTTTVPPTTTTVDPSIYALEHADGPCEAEQSSPVEIPDLDRNVLSTHLDRYLLLEPVAA